MKSILFLSILFFAFTKSNAQTHIINSNKSTQYLKIIDNTFEKIKKLPQSNSGKSGTHHAITDRMISCGEKVLNGKRYNVQVEKAEKEIINIGFGDVVNIISKVHVYISTNNSKTQYFPLEVISFYYVHNTATGSVDAYTRKRMSGRNDEGSVIVTSPEEAKKRVEEILLKINQFI